MSTITNNISVNKSRRAGLIAAVIGQALLGREAFAAVDCSTLTNPVYGLGGSAQKPIIAKFAAGLAAAPVPQTIVYQAPGACLGIDGLLGATLLTGTASYWDTSANELTCTLPIVGPPVDFAAMGNSATSCPGITALPADVGDFEGPVNTYDLIVPVASSQISISSEAAYFAFGLGAQGKAQPWIDETQLFRRDQNSAAQIFIGLATGIPAQKFKGVNTLTNTGTLTAVAQSPNPEAALGLVSGELADANRSTVRTLAYQHVGQRCGFLPDTTATSFDKKNVRNGIYYIWAPLHFFAKVDTSNKIVSPGAAQFIGLFTGDVASPTASFSVLDTEIKAGTVPKCAMNVWRDTDLGNVSKYAPATPCGCYFDSVATGTSSCTVCTTNANCTSPTATTCRNGFCEAR